MENRVQQSKFKKQAWGESESENRRGETRSRRSVVPTGEADPPWRQFQGIAAGAGLEVFEGTVDNESESSETGYAPAGKSPAVARR
jgi:hypothetical protein